MASPPFNIDPTVPLDTGIVSQYPLQERTMRDNAKSWLLVNHNTSGRHSQVDLDAAATPTAPTAATLTVWADGFGQHFQRWGGSGAGGANTTEFVGVPPGVVLPSALGVAPAGYLFCNGQAVSRSTYARLFGAIGTQYGVGDGSSTFNVPDLRARFVLGQDNMGGAGTTTRVSFGGSGIDAPTLSAGGGSQSLQSHNHGVSDPQHLHFINSNTGGQSNGHQHNTFVSLSGTTSGMSANQNPTFTYNQSNDSNQGVNATGANATVNKGNFSANTGATNIDHTHTWAGSGTFLSDGPSADHTHPIILNTNPNSTGISIQSTGAGGSQNMPPCLVLTYIIKF